MNDYLTYSHTSLFFSVFTDIPKTEFNDVLTSEVNLSTPSDVLFRTISFLIKRNSIHMSRPLNNSFHFHDQISHLFAINFRIPYYSNKSLTYVCLYSFLQSWLVPVRYRIYDPLLLSCLWLLYIGLSNLLLILFYHRILGPFINKQTKIITV